MTRTIKRPMINRPRTSRRTRSLATKLMLMMLCSLLLLASTALAQETRAPEPAPDTQQRSDERTAADKDAPPPANGLLEVINPAQQPNLAVTDGEIVFDSPGVATYARDIRLSDNLGGLRFYGTNSLTTSPSGAAIQFFGNQASPFNGQLFLDSGAFNSAALIFRTAQTGGTITERMRVRSDGNVGIGTTNPVTRLHVQGSGSIGTDSVLVDGGNGNGVYSFTAGSGAGVIGQSFTGAGVHGLSSGRGVYGQSSNSNGVHGFSSAGGFGVYGESSSDRAGVYGVSNSGPGVFGTSFNGYAGEFAGRVRIGSIPQLPTNAQLCFNINGDLLQCGASSLRLKSDVRSFVGGLDLVRQLRPISFRWKENGMADIGLGAEEVAEIAPSFVFSNSKGEVTGVKYERLNMVLINAVKEQQAQIEQQQNQIESLKKLVCLNHPDAEVCKAGGK